MENVSVITNERKLNSSGDFNIQIWNQGVWQIGSIRQQDGQAVRSGAE